MWDVYRVWAMVFTLFCRYPTRVCMCVATCHTRCWRCAVMCSTASAVLCGASVLCATRGYALALPCVCRGLCAVCCFGAMPSSVHSSRMYVPTALGICRSNNIVIVIEARRF